MSIAIYVILSTSHSTKIEKFPLTCEVSFPYTIFKVFIALISDHAIKFHLLFKETY